MVAWQRESVAVHAPDAMREAALPGLGITLVAVPEVHPDLDRSDLVRLLPRWYAEAGAVAFWFASRAHLPAKTRPFAD